jgi:hypothetical protein
VINITLFIEFGTLKKGINVYNELLLKKLKRIDNLIIVKKGNILNWFLIYLFMKRYKIKAKIKTKNKNYQTFIYNSIIEEETKYFLNKNNNMIIYCSNNKPKTDTYILSFQFCKLSGLISFLNQNLGKINVGHT